MRERRESEKEKRRKVEGEKSVINMQADRSSSQDSQTAFCCRFRSAFCCLQAEQFGHQRRATDGKREKREVGSKMEDARDGSRTAGSGVRGDTRSFCASHQFDARSMGAEREQQSHTTSASRSTYLRRSLLVVRCSSFAVLRPASRTTDGRVSPGDWGLKTEG